MKKIIRELPLRLEKDKQLLKFNDASISINERIAIIEFNGEEKMVEETLIYKKAVYCFLLIEGGKVDLEVNAIRKEVSKDTLVCGIPGDTWIWHSKTELKGKFIIFESSFPLAGLKGGYSLEPISYLNSDSHDPFIRLSDKKFKRLKILGEDMKECIEETPVFWDLLRAQLWEFIFLVEKEYMANGQGIRKTDNENRLPEFINLVNKYYRTNHETSFYAEKLNITSNYLNKIVKANLGLSAREFILGRLISEAKILLRLTETNISEIAYNLGFENPNYFIRYFKKIEGITPGEYKKKGTLGQ